MEDNTKGIIKDLESLMGSVGKIMQNYTDEQRKEMEKQLNKGADKMEELNELRQKMKDIKIDLNL
jgi:ElaB/YqjD/DUF883 family membrane-anchored ribosome-binding protein